MSLDRIDQFLNVAGKGLNLAVSLACILLAGVIAYFILLIAGFTGFFLMALTGLIALVGGLVFKLVLGLLSHIL